MPKPRRITPQPDPTQDLVDFINDELTPADSPAQPLAADDVLRLMYEPPAPSDPTRTDPSILSKPAFGQALQHTAAPLEERENTSYAWTRTNYHNFVEHIGSVETARAEGLESSLGSQELRDYTLKQLIGLSGHPDPRIAIKALDMLAKSKFVALYDEKRNRSADEMSPDEIDREIQRLLAR